jgi:dTDP-6-deoxy-L-talose 4-dehydrogenase (NAD+)
MKVLVTGATGFVGRHVVARLLERGHEVTALGRDASKLERMPWRDRATFIACDLHRDFAPAIDRARGTEVLVHLAWPGLPNYKDAFHLERNLPADLRFLAAAAREGIARIVVAGTCFEYGMQHGPLREDMATFPTTAYGLAKDALRKSLEVLRKSAPFTLQWVRLFYMHGEGQNPGSLLAQLDRAIAEGRARFDMSPGDQLRDYLSIEEVAANFAKVVEHAECEGVINCCSGKPVSVRELVERRLRERGATMELERGKYPYPDYEPLAFWGVPEKLSALG